MHNNDQNTNLFAQPTILPTGLLFTLIDKWAEQWLTDSITLHSDWQVGGATQNVQRTIVRDLFEVLVVHV